MKLTLQHCVRTLGAVLILSGISFALTSERKARDHELAETIRLMRALSELQRLQLTDPEQYAVANAPNVDKRIELRIRMLQQEWFINTRAIGYIIGCALILIGVTFTGYHRSTSLRLIAWAVGFILFLVVLVTPTFIRCE